MVVCPVAVLACANCGTCAERVEEKHHKATVMIAAVVLRDIECSCVFILLRLTGLPRLFFLPIIDVVERTAGLAVASGSKRVKSKKVYIKPKPGR